MKKLVKGSLVLVILLMHNMSYAKVIKADPDQPISVKISKAGLNRITNPPYKIVQVTGDDSKYKLKYDEDGSNIYFMPRSAMGEKIEISIKNNAGLVHDMRLEVANIKGQSLIIKGFNKVNLVHVENEDISQMLAAMNKDIADKFYVQTHRVTLSNIDQLSVEQIKLYRWKDLVGGVFEITNKTRADQEFNYMSFIDRFDQPVTYFVSANNYLAAKEKSRIFIIQKNQSR